MGGSVRIPFGKNLTRIMKERGYRIQDVTQLAGVGKSVVHSWMTGTTPRDLPAVKRLADALGVQFLELLMGERETQTEIHESSPFDEVPVFEGVCRVRIERLKPALKRLPDREM